MKLIEFAIEKGAELLSPVDESSIAAFENRHELRLPESLRDFYINAGGTEEFTDWLWRIWPFSELTTLDKRIKKEPNIEYLDGHFKCPDLKDYIPFMDALIEAPLYAVCANEKNSKFSEVISLAGDSNPFLAGPIVTFDEFVLILEQHWEDVILPNSISEQTSGGNVG